MPFLAASALNENREELGFLRDVLSLGETHRLGQAQRRVGQKQVVAASGHSSRREWRIEIWTPEPRVPSTRHMPLIVGVGASISIASAPEERPSSVSIPSAKLEEQPSCSA
jgi:hypothetical protein